MGCSRGSHKQPCSPTLSRSDTNSTGVITLDVLTAAWAAAASPAHPNGTSGSCARCSTAGAAFATRSVVSKTFTSYSSWANPSGSRICARCAWAYQTADLRLNPHLVTGQPSLSKLSRPAVAALLAAGHLDPTTALIVPLRPGRKHLIPEAGWGRVTLDDVQLPWTARDAARLSVVVDLRRRGFGSRMLTEAAPPWLVLRRLPTTSWAQVMDFWAQLQPWRAPASPWLALALHATTTHTPEEAS